MSLDEVMTIAFSYGQSRRFEREELSDKRMDELRAAIEQHVAETVAEALKQCLSDCCTQAIRARADNEDEQS